MNAVKMTLPDRLCLGCKKPINPLSSGCIHQVAGEFWHSECWKGNRMARDEIVSLLGNSPMMDEAIASSMMGQDEPVLTERTIEELEGRLMASTMKYGPMASHWEAMGVLDGEVHEVRLAIHARDTEAIYAEFADCANTCIKWMQEMERRGLV